MYDDDYISLTGCLGVIFSVFAAVLFGFVLCAACEISGYGMVPLFLLSIIGNIRFYTNEVPVTRKDVKPWMGCIPFYRIILDSKIAFDGKIVIGVLICIASAATNIVGLLTQLNIISGPAAFIIFLVAAVLRAIQAKALYESLHMYTKKGVMIAVYGTSRSGYMAYYLVTSLFRK